MHEPMPMTLNDALMGKRGHQLANFAIWLNRWPYPLPGSNYRAVDLHSVESPTLGATLVVSFSIGLALTLVTVGVGAAISVEAGRKTLERI